tara:strand:- start:9512 stop:9922 length:411 start_codon:yes stop_codon:yes gene_type:complete
MGKPRGGAGRTDPECGTRLESGYYEVSERWLHNERLEHNAPSSFIEALMQTPPGETSADSLESRLWLHDVVLEALETLPEEDQWILQMLLVVQIPLRRLGTLMDIPKTSLARRRDAALEMVKERLLEHDDIRELYL